MAFIYVDKTLGDDANAGTQASPYKTISKAESVVSAGDNIYLKRGEIWRPEDFAQRTDQWFGGQVASAFPTNVLPFAWGNGADAKWDGTRIFGYGAGTLGAPVIDLRKEVTETWTKVGGRTNVYKVQIARVQQDGDANRVYGGVWEDNTIDVNGDLLTKQDTIGDVDSNAGSWYMDSSGSTYNDYYVHTPNSDNPSTNGKTYRVRYYDSAFVCFYGTTGTPHTTIPEFHDIRIIGAAHHNGALWGDMKVDDSRIDDKAVHGTMITANLGDPNAVIHASDCNYYTKEDQYGGGYAYHCFPLQNNRDHWHYFDNCNYYGKSGTYSAIAAFGSHPHAGSGATNENINLSNGTIRNIKSAFDFTGDIPSIAIGDFDIQEARQYVTYKDNDNGNCGIDDTLFISSPLTDSGRNVDKINGRGGDIRISDGACAWTGYKHCLYLNNTVTTRPELEFEGQIVVINEVVNGWEFLRSSGNTTGPKLIFRDCIIVNLAKTSGGAWKSCEMLGGSDIELVAERSYFFNFEFDGETDVDDVEANHSGFDASSCYIENTTNPFVGDPYDNDWEISSSSNADNISVSWLS